MDPISKTVSALLSSMDPATKARLRNAQADVAAFDATVLALNGREFIDPDRRYMTEDLRMFVRERSRYEDGFLFLVEFKDTRGNVCRLHATQSGKTWPALVYPDQGKGALARNRWAALRFAEVYKQMRHPEGE